MKIIIVGCGNVGMALVTRLSAEGHDITVIDENPAVVTSAVNNNDAMGIVGNGASFETLKDAGIKDAHLMIAVTPSDERNLLCCLIARKAGGCHTIARVRNPVYRKEISYIKEELGLSMVINPEETAANDTARLLKFPSAGRIEPFAGGRAELVSITVSKGSKLCDKSLAEIQAEFRSSVLIAVVCRGDETHIPNGSFVLREGDEISIIGASREIASLFRKLNLPTTKVRSTLIVGGGDTAYYLAKQLISFGVELKIFEKNNERCKELTDLLPEALIINADGTDKDMLLEEGLTGTESFVALTNLDEENIMLSLYVKSVAPKAKVITKVHRVNYSEIIGGLGLDSVIYPRSITADRIVKFVRGMAGSMGSSVERLYKISDGKAEAMEFLVRDGAKICGIPLQQLKLREGVLIALLSRKGEIISPNGRSVIQPGDSVVVVTGDIACKDIGDILR